jgi:hypothetical protein
MKVFKFGPAIVVFALAAALAGCGSSGTPQRAVAHQASSGGSAQRPSVNSTGEFPDGTKVTFISANWTMTPDGLGPGVKFTFRIVAGPGWKQNARFQLRPASGSERPYNYYMVTAVGWTYPASNSTGYADVSDISLAGGGQESGEGALLAGESVYAYSTLVTKSVPPNPQHLVVTIEMPNGKLQSRSFVAHVNPDSLAASPSSSAAPVTSQAPQAPSASLSASPVFNADAGTIAVNATINVYKDPTPGSKILFTADSTFYFGVICSVQGPAVTTSKATSTQWDYVQYDTSPPGYGYVNDAWLDDAETMAVPAC